MNVSSTGNELMWHKRIRRNASGARSEYARYPSINFSHLFSGSGSRGIRPVQAAKLKCLFHYFARVTSHMPEGVLTFSRQVLHPAPQWERSEASLTNLRVDSTGTIEDNGQGMLQVGVAWGGACCGVGGACCGVGWVYCGVGVAWGGACRVIQAVFTRVTEEVCVEIDVMYIVFNDQTLVG